MIGSSYVGRSPCFQAELCSMALRNEGIRSTRAPSSVGRVLLLAFVDHFELEVFSDCAVGMVELRRSRRYISSMLLAAGMRLGPYEIVEPIGKGAMGEVYRARDTRLERDVAIKVLAEHSLNETAP